MTCSTYRWARGSCSGARTFSAVMSRSNWNCWIAAKVLYAAPAWRAAASSTSSTSVTFRHTSGSTPRKRSVRPSVSTHANAAACPRCVTSYGVMPHAYTRARSSSSTRWPAITAAGAPPAVWIPVMVPVSAMAGAAARSNLPHVTAELDFLDHLARESARFAEAITAAPPGATVPSCPGWNADDLLWHLGEVQWLWGMVVRERVTGDRAETLKPPRPADRAGLAAFYDCASHGLADILAATPPDTPAWTWSEDQTVGFIRRRQAHEALIHRVDAELTAGRRTPMDP